MYCKLYHSLPAFLVLSLHCVVVSIPVAACVCSPVLFTAAQGSTVRSHQILRGLLGIDLSSPRSPHRAVGDQGLRPLVPARGVCLLLFLCSLFCPCHLTPTQLYQCCAPAVSTNFQHLDYRLQLNIDSTLLYLFIQQIFISCVLCVRALF